MLGIATDFLINGQIRYPKVRLIDSDGSQVGVVDIEKARDLAKERELDLVLIAQTAEPPVCKIADYGHLRYEAMKKEKSQRKSSKSTSLKELKLSVKIGTHDFEVRKRAAENFLNSGLKVKLSLMFKGREAVHPEVGRDLLNRFCESLSEISQAEWMEDGKGENRRSLVIVLTPKKAPKPGKSETKSDVKVESKKEEVKG